MNSQIRAPKVRVVDLDGGQAGIIDIQEALDMAGARGVDLVEVAPNADPPVCRIMDYGKFKYEQSKKEKTQRKKQHVIHVKEIRLRPKIDDHDFNFKKNHAQRFLEQGNKVKVTVRFRGREMAHKEFGSQLLNRMVEELSEVAKVERMPQMEGPLMVMYLVKK